MTSLVKVMRLIWASERKAMARGALLTVTVLAAGVALLGLSGWFITAAAAAGLAGIGIAFNVFQPSAGVRLLALGRTAARYGERLLTHDAVLKTLTHIRVRLLSSLFALPYPQLSRLRGAEALNRLVADVNALDGIALRIFLPALAMATVYAGSFVMLWWLTDAALAYWVIGIFTFGSVAAMRWAARRTERPSRMAEKGQQAFRLRLIDVLRTRDDLVVYRRFEQHKAAIHAAETRMNASLAKADQLERRAGVALSITATLAAGGALWLGGGLVQSGVLVPAQAALAFFVALALAEATAPLQRGLADLGRMQQAARNVVRLLETPKQQVALMGAVSVAPQAPALVLRDVGYRHPGAKTPVLNGYNLSVARGETVALTSPSGRGKSTVLALTSGLIRPDAGEITVLGAPMAHFSDTELRQRVGFLPQRSAILGRTFFEVLALGAPDLGETEALAALKATALSGLVSERGGLHAALRDNGDGLSGGEKRRLALARALLRKPELLLLDEPTEGLDAKTARIVLDGIRAFLPDASILTASHRQAERDWADRIVTLL